METLSSSSEAFDAIAYNFLSPLCAYVLLAIMLWALFRRRFAFVTIVTLVTPYGIGHAPLGSFLSFAKISFFLALFSIGWMTFLALEKKRTQPSAKAKFPPFTLAMIALLILVLVKSGADTIWLGLDEYRKSAWFRVFTGVMVPSAMLTLSYVVKPTRETIEDYFKAFLLVIGIWLVFGLVAAFIADPASLFLGGDLRLKLHNADTITSVRLVPLFMSGLCWLIVARDQRVWSLACYGLMLASIFVVLLTGTRQVALSCAVLLLLFMVMRGLARWAGVILLVGLVGYLSYTQLRESSLVSRLTMESVREDGRTEVWMSAYEQLLAKPLTGFGFREWGPIYVQVDPGTGETKALKDTAHGLFQDLFVDHGLIIGGTFFLLYVLVVSTALYRLLRRGDLFEKAGMLAFVGTSVNFFFSGSLASSELFMATLGLYIICTMAARRNAPQFAPRMLGAMPPGLTAARPSRF